MYGEHNMGTFTVHIGIGHPAGGDLAPVSAMVDTGSIHSMIPGALLARLGLAALERLAYALADGREVEYGYGIARFAIDGREFPCPVIFGPDEEYLLGATTLEIFNLTVDPVRQLLLPTQYRARPI